MNLRTNFVSQRLWLADGADERARFRYAFLDTTEWIGFPLYDEPPAYEVDAKLAGDLPDGPDPRVYVHEVKHPAPIGCDLYLMFSWKIKQHLR